MKEVARGDRDVAIAAGPLVELKAGIRVDLGQRLFLRDAAERHAKIGSAGGLVRHHLISVRAADRSSLGSAGADAWIVGEKGLAEAEGHRGQRQPLRGDET